MKDRQVEHATSQPRIPVISGVLHCVAMSVLVYLRSGFGFAFLKPRSIFLAGAWAFILFAIVVTTEGMFWRFAGVYLFGLGASTLYILHLTVTFGSELRDTAKSDFHSGTPHLIRILEMAGIQPQPEFRKFWVLWAEPALVVFAAVVARWPLGERYLSNWFLLVAPCLWFKEFLNHWLQIRQRKRQRDAMEDAETGLDAIHPQKDSMASGRSRKEKIKRQRTR